MVYDMTMLEAFYRAYKGKVEHVRGILKRPLMRIFMMPPM